MKQNSRKNAGMWKVSYFDRVGICRVCDPPQAENPAWQDSLSTGVPYRLSGKCINTETNFCEKYIKSKNKKENN